MLFLYLEAAGDPIPALSAETLRIAYGQHLDIPPEANTIRMRCGHDPSLACLLLPKSVLDTINAEVTTHRIRLVSSATSSDFNIDGWNLHSAYCIDPSKSEATGEAVYVVYFADRRHWFQHSPSLFNGYNVVSPFVPEPPAFNPDVANQFPYEPDSLPAGSTPYDWRTDIVTSEVGILDTLWSLLPSAGAFPTIAFDPDPGSPGFGSPFPFPTQRPGDVRTEGRTAWRIFIDLIHSIGWEVYPLHTGGFLLSPIGGHYNGGNILASFDTTRLLDAAFPQEEANRLPTAFRIWFQARNSNLRWRNMRRFYAVSLVTAAYFPDDILLPGGVEPSDFPFAPTTEHLTNGAATAVFKQTSALTAAPENLAQITQLAEYQVRQIIRERISASKGHQYSGFIDLPPLPHFPEVRHVMEGGPHSDFLAPPYDLNPSVIPPIDDGSAQTVTPEDHPIVFIHNNTGLDKPQGTIYGIGLPLPESVSALATRPVFESQAPAEGVPFAVSLDAASGDASDDASTVRCLMTAGVWTMLNQIDALHGWAEAQTGNYDLLKSGTKGRAKVIWRERIGVAGPGTLGNQRAWVHIDAASAFEIRVAVVEDASIPAASGLRLGPITPGLGNARLYNYASQAGAPAVRSNETVVVENYALSVVARWKVIGICERAPGIWKIVWEGCKVIPDTPSG